MLPPLYQSQCWMVGENDQAQKIFGSNRPYIWDEGELSSKLVMHCFKIGSLFYFLNVGHDVCIEPVIPKYILLLGKFK